MLTTLMPDDPFSEHLHRAPESWGDLLALVPTNTVVAVASWKPTAPFAAGAVAAARDAAERAAKGLALPFQLHWLTQPVAQLPDWVPSTLLQWSANTTTVTVTGVGVRVHSPRLDAHYDWLAPPPTTALLLGVCETPCPCQPLAVRLTSPGWLVAQHGFTCPWREVIVSMQASGVLGLLVQPSHKAAPVPFLEPATPDDAAQMPVNFSAAAIPHAAGQALRRALGVAGSGPLRLEFGSKEGPAQQLALDCRGRVQEVGRLELPSLAHVAWAAQHLHARERQRWRLSDEDAAGALQVEVMAAEVLPPEGRQRQVLLPPLELLNSFDSVNLLMRLECEGLLDRHCPYWDHVLQLFVCCDDPQAALPACPACSTTVWSPREAAHGRHVAAHASRAPVGRTHEHFGGGSGCGGGGGALCGWELGRWVTPFRRRGGEWITDVTPLRGLLTSQRCLFTLQGPPWAGPWVPSVSLRFTNTSGEGIDRRHGSSAGTTLASTRARRQPVLSTGQRGSGASGVSPQPAVAGPSPAVPARRRVVCSLEGSRTDDAPSVGGAAAPAPGARGAAPRDGAAPRPCSARPAALVPLFRGGVFDARFNARRPSLEVVLPPGVCRAQLVATLTGHGYDDHECLEYCSSSHLFVVNDAVHNLTFAVSGVESTDRGCTASVARGGTPNQYGTWMYGRGGWCDGLQVDPWVVDLTPQLATPGTPNRLQYAGLFQGRDPSPRGVPGYVMLESSLVVSMEAARGPPGVLRCVEERQRALDSSRSVGSLADYAGGVV